MMDSINKLDGKIDNIKTDISEMKSELKLSNQKNIDDHNEFNKRINCLESDQTISKKVWYDFVNSPIIWKAIVVIVFLIVVGGSGVTIAELVGLL